MSVTQRGTGERLYLSSSAALALPDLLGVGQVRTKARELYVQTCGGGKKKDKSPQALTIATALPAGNAAGGKRTLLTFLVLKRPGEIKKGKRREPKQGQAWPPLSAGSAPPAHSRAKGINAA